jgi:hypothetical protein
MKKRSTELWLSTQLRLLVDSDQTYRKIAGFINKHHGQVNRVLMKLPAESFSGNFGIQQSIQIPPRKVLINGTSFSAELCVRVKSKDSQRNKEIYEALHAYKKDIVERSNAKYIMILGDNVLLSKDWDDTLISFVDLNNCVVSGNQKVSISV